MNKNFKSLFALCMFGCACFFMSSCMSSSVKTLSDGNVSKGKYAQENVRDVKLPQKKRRAVFMGNSITDLWFHDWHGDLHPEFFTENGYLCRGISGQRTDQMLERFDTDVIALRPYVVAILAGVNDIGGNGGVKYSEGTTLINLITMANKAKAAGISPVLCSLLPWGGADDTKKDQIESLNAKLRSFCELNDIPFVDYYHAMVDEKRDLKQEYKGNKGTDGLHPGKSGYLVMESILKPVIEKIIESK